MGKEDSGRYSFAGRQGWSPGFNFGKLGQDVDFWWLVLHFVVFEYNDLRYREEYLGRSGDFARDSEVESLRDNGSFNSFMEIFYFRWFSRVF
jgi:hypothetical protein